MKEIKVSSALTSSIPIYLNHLISSIKFSLVPNHGSTGKPRHTRPFDNGIVEVTGSIPVGSTNKTKGLADLG